MNPTEFSYLCEFLYKRSGLALTPEKRYLVDSRLSLLCRRYNIPGLSALVAKLRSGGDPAFAEAVVEAMTTNETLFFRDSSPFELFRKVVVPEFVARRDSGMPLRIWCAAVSSGQEAYSLAMALDEMPELMAGRRYEILGTDLSQEVIDKAKAGLYSQFEVQRGLPVQMLVKHFTQVGDQWRISDRLKMNIRFQVFNLLDDPTKFGQFDVIFCRNVMIYFDIPTKAKVIATLAARLRPGGSVVLGAAETALGISDALVPDRVNRGLYRLPQADSAPSLGSGWRRAANA